MKYQDKYKIIHETIIDKYVYGFMVITSNSVFYAIADGWEVLFNDGDMRLFANTFMDFYYRRLY